MYIFGRVLYIAKISNGVKYIMVRRRRRQKYNALDYVRLPKIDLDTETKRSIGIVIILAVGGVSLLSLFGLSGALGVYLEQAMLVLFGWGRWLFPIFLLIIGFLLYNRGKDWVRGASYLGLFLFVIFFSALLHLFISQDNWSQTIASGAGGGYLGYLIVLAFDKIMGFWASLIVIIGLLLISFMLMFNAPLETVIGRDSWFAKMLYPINFILNKIFRRSSVEAEIKEEEAEEEFSEEAEPAEAEEAEEEELASGFHTHKIKAESNEAQTEQLGASDEVWQTSNVKIDLPLDLLSSRNGKPISGDIKNNCLIIQKALSNFNIPVEMGEINIGPTVTQYTLRPAEGVKLSRITTLNNDLALALASHPIRIEAPIPGRSLVGIEVPNQIKAIVSLKEILTDSVFKNRKSNLTIALGKDVSNKVWVDDLGKMPHLLVAGATNSGKSVCLNSIIVSLLYQNSPDELRFILVDPKRVELLKYNGIPHLVTPVIIEVDKTINALKWCLNEMDRRFGILARADKVNIDNYNKISRDKLPNLVFIIDELADLMVAAPREVEACIIRLVQMSRAVGIHLILATQRPSVNIITGLIKANMPARIAFSVASGIDSRTILDSLGAEKLLGRGDMLFNNSSLSKPKRLQGSFVSENEIKRVVSYIKERTGKPNYLEQVLERQKVKVLLSIGKDNYGEDDPLLEQAKDIIINAGKASASYLQRRLSIGYARAARLLDLLEKQGVIGPGDGAKVREVLISQEQYDSIINQGVSGVKLHKQEETEAPDEYLEPSDASTDAEAMMDEEAMEGEEGEEEIDEEDQDDEPDVANKKTGADEEDDQGKYFSR